MRLMYSLTTGSVTMWADFSISIEYCLPVEISQLVEYQLPRPRSPILRFPTALTSSSLPALMWGSRASPGDGSESVLGVVALALTDLESVAFGSGFVSVGLLSAGLASADWLPVWLSAGFASV